jgi:inhibitor of KinA sporulation pathway (predicted exonuclease)
MKNFKYANAIDLELTCYPFGIFPEGEIPEIIEIGLAEIDLENLTVTRKLSLPVKPTVSKVSPYCTDLTDWTQQKLDKVGRTFAQACRTLSKYGCKNRLIITDTSDEIVTFSEQCARMNVENPFGLEILNVSTLMALTTEQVRNLTLQEKLARLNMTFVGEQHHGIDDAENIALIYITLMKGCRAGLAQFRRNPSSD